MIGQPFSRLLTPENTFEDADILGKIRDESEIEPYEAIHIRKDGSSISTFLTISPIYDEDRKSVV